jgi:hypothetical protein
LDEIKSYFIGINEEECPQVIYELVWEESDERLTLSEVYLHFTYEYMKIFSDTILELEKKSTNATQVYNIMLTLRGKLKNRINLKFYGSDINEKLNTLSLDKKKSFEKSSLDAYSKAINYLEKWFDFNNSVFKKFSALNLDKELDYFKLIEIVNYFNIIVDKTYLFDECAKFNEVFQQFTTEDKSLEIDKLWSKILKSSQFPNMYKIIETVFAIPVSNAFVERVFSIMKNLWSDERNLLSVNLVKAEIYTKVNFSMSCYEFADYVSKNSELIKAAKSNEKYKLSLNN